MSLPKEVQKLKKRAEEAFAHKDGKWESLLQKVWRYTMPERDMETMNTGGDIFRHLWDSTAPRAALNLANQMVSGLTPPWSQWFELAPGPGIVDDNEKQDMISELKLINLDLFTQINASNFLQEMQPTLLDGIVGTGCIKIEPTDDNTSIRFKNIPIDQIAIREGRESTIDHVYHKMKMHADEIVERFGEKLNSSQRDSLNQEPDKKMKIMAIVVPDKGTKFVHYLILESFDGIVLEKKELDYNPYKVFRWSKLPNDAYGRGPALLAVSDAKNLNNIQEFRIRNMHFASIGAWTVVDDGITNAFSLSITPGARIPVATNDTASPSIAKLPMGSDMNVAQLGVSELRDSIEEQFFANRFSPKVGTKFSAAEVHERGRQIALAIGPTYGLLTVELLIPLIRAMIIIRSKQDSDVYEPIEELLQRDRFTLEIQFRASIAQAQRSGEASDHLQFLQTVGTFTQIFPQAAGVVDPDVLLRHVGNLLNIIPTAMRSPDEAKAHMEKALQGAQQLQQAQGQPQQGAQDGQGQPTV